MNDQLTAAIDAWSAEDTKARRAARAAIVNKRHEAKATAREAWQAADNTDRTAKQAGTDSTDTSAAESAAWAVYKAADRACMALNTLTRGETKGGY